MKQHMIVLGLLAAIGAAVAACSSNSSSGTPAPTCDSSKCYPGNECVNDGHATKCRLTCRLNGDGTGGQQTCPFNYHCVDGPIPYCAPDATPYTNSGKGLWGAPCVATGGFDQNPACDAAQSFWCYGQSPTDGSAFCTQFQCASDADCRGGWWCATVNVKPNVVNPTRSVGQTTTVCLPRTYCSTCQTDIDCAFDHGMRQHCVADNSGGKFCTPECSAASNCNQEAACQAPDVDDTWCWELQACCAALPAGDQRTGCENAVGRKDASQCSSLLQALRMLPSGACAGAKVCVPRAGACVGDGGFCSPCRSDADCRDGGACVSSSYSTEHFCAVPSKKPCGTQQQGTCTTDASGVAQKPYPTCHLVADCPKNTIPGGAASCTFAPDKNPCQNGTDSSGTPNCTQPPLDYRGNQWPSIPNDFCYGTVTLGQGDQQANVPGCYTAPR